MKNVFSISAMAIILAICNVFAANSQDTSVEPVVTEECVMNVSLSHDMVKNKKYADAYEFWLAAYEDCPNANKAIYVDGAKIIEALYNSTFDKKEKRRLAELAIELQDKRIQYYGNDPKYPTAYILGEKGLAYLDFWGDEKIVEAHECLQQSVQQFKERSKIVVLVKLVDASYELYKKNPKRNKSEFIADCHLASMYLEMQATDPNNKNADIAEKMKKYVDTIFNNSGI